MAKLERIFIEASESEIASVFMDIFHSKLGTGLEQKSGAESALFDKRHTAYESCSDSFSYRLDRAIEDTVEYFLTEKNKEAFISLSSDTRSSKDIEHGVEYSIWKSSGRRESQINNQQINIAFKFSESLVKGSRFNQSEYFSLVGPIALVGLVSLISNNPPFFDSLEDESAMETKGANMAFIEESKLPWSAMKCNTEASAKYDIMKKIDSFWTSSNANKMLIEEHGVNAMSIPVIIPSSCPLGKFAGTTTNSSLKRKGYARFDAKIIELVLKAVKNTDDDFERFLLDSVRSHFRYINSRGIVMNKNEFTTLGKNRGKKSDLRFEFEFDGCFFESDLEDPFGTHFSLLYTSNFIEYLSILLDGKELPDFRGVVNNLYYEKNPLSDADKAVVMAKEIIDSNILIHPRHLVSLDKKEVSEVFDSFKKHISRVGW